MTGVLVALAMVAAVFATSLLSGIFGMAGGLILLWLLFFLVPVGTAIAVHGIIQVVSNASRAVISRRYIDWRIGAFAVIGLGLASAVFFLVRYTPNLAVVQIVIGLMPILVWIPRRWLALDAARWPQAVLCGFISGSLSVGVGVSGPTIDIFFIRTAMDRRRIIATKSLIQVLSHFIKVLFYFDATLVLSGNDWWLVAAAAPIAVLGTRTGNIILQRLTDDGFRSWTRWIVTAVGAVYLVRGIMLLVTP